MAIEKRLFAHRRGKSKPQLFFYDVTSSYLEGDCNELADWGYNRDKKRGQKQALKVSFPFDQGAIQPDGQSHLR